MASTEDNAVLSIFGLPDELLMNIFSYVSFIPDKMNLEQVCQRIHSVAAHPQSWKGIHKIKIILTSCDDIQECNPYNSLLERRNNGNRSTNGENIFLNGIGVPFPKWPAAIKLLFDRTNINELIIHIGKDVDVFQPNPTVIPELIELFQQNHNKMKLKSLELYLCSHPTAVTFSNLASTLVQDQFTSILTESLQMSTPYLEQFVLDVRVGGSTSFNGSFPDIWPLLDQCNSLKSVKYSSDDNIPIDLRVLIGKPLTKVEIGVDLTIDIFDDLIDVINGATGSGVQYLLLPNFHQCFRYLRDHLNANLREMLKVLILGDHNIEEIEQIILNLSLFANLEKMEIGYANLLDSNSQFCSLVVSLLGHVQAQSSNCEVIIRARKVITTELRSVLSRTCRKLDIAIQFDYSYTEKIQFVMSRGHGNIVAILNKV